MKKMRLQVVFFFLLVTKVASVAAQPILISNAKQYKDSVAKNSSCALVDLGSFSKDKLVYFDLRYATKNNFTKTNLYTKATTTYLVKDAAAALLNVALVLKTRGYAIKIFDAYRPYSATKLMWDLIKDERYVANPASGSNHNRGLSIDLTLVTTNGSEINMGTGFDNFTDTAHHSFTALPQEVVAARKLLKQTMEANGFKALDTEWWHYTFITSQKYPVLDLSFKTLKKIIR